MKPDWTWNIQQNMQHMLEAKYGNNILLFEEILKDNLNMMGKEDLDTKEYTDSKQKIIDSFFDTMTDLMKGEHTEQTIAFMANIFKSFDDTYNSLSRKYMQDVSKFLVNHVNKSK